MSNSGSNLMSALNLIIDAVSPAKALIFAAAPVVCIAGAAVLNPEGAINTFMIKCIDLMVVVFPSTPEQMKLGYLLNGLFESNPFIGFVALEIMQGIAGILAIVGFFKLVKALPFL